MRLRSVLPVIAVSGGLLLVCQPAPSIAATTQRDTVLVTAIVDYRCEVTGSASQEVQVRVELTMPADAAPGVETTIGWRGSYAGGTELRAPAAGLPEGANFYTYAGISRLPRLTSATGVAPLGAIGAGEPIPLPADMVAMATTPRESGTGIVRPAALNVGVRPNDQVIDCEVRNKAALTTYTLNVGGAGQTSSPTPTPTDPSPTPTATSPSPTPTETESQPEAGGEVTRTPVGGAGTGGGGATGPDGRPLVLTGSLLVLAAGTGLLLRRRGHRTVADSRT